MGNSLPLGDIIPLTTIISLTTNCSKYFFLLKRDTVARLQSALADKYKTSIYNQYLQSNFKTSIYSFFIAKFQNAPNSLSFSLFISFYSFISLFFFFFLFSFSFSQDTIRGYSAFKMSLGAARFPIGFIQKFLQKILKLCLFCQFTNTGRQCIIYVCLRALKKLMN